MDPTEQPMDLQAGVRGKRDAPAFLDRAMEGGHDVAWPRRGTPEYEQLVRHVATEDGAERVLDLLTLLRDEYGWRGPVDVMVEWTEQIDRSLLAQDSRCRDLTGTVDLTKIIIIHEGEEDRLRMALRKQAAYQEEDGLAPHLAFRQGLSEVEAGLESDSRWLPRFRAALAAAHTTGQRRPVLAELAKFPHRDDPQALVRGALVLGTAAWGVRRHAALSLHTDSAAGAPAPLAGMRWADQESG